MLEQAQSRPTRRSGGLSGLAFSFSSRRMQQISVPVSIKCFLTVETDYTDQSWISLLMVFLLLIPIKPVIFMKTEKSNYFTTSVMFLA